LGLHSFGMLGESAATAEGSAFQAKPGILSKPMHLLIDLVKFAENQRSPLSGGHERQMPIGRFEFRPEKTVVGKRKGYQKHHDETRTILLFFVVKRMTEMTAVTKRWFFREPAAAQGHRSFHRFFRAVRLDQFKIAAD